MTQMMELSDKDLKAAIITIFYEVKVNIFKMNGMLEDLSREIESVKRKQMKTKNVISEI